MSKKPPTEVKQSIKRIAAVLPPITQMQLTGKIDEDGNPIVVPCKQLQILKGKKIIEAGRNKTSTDGDVDEDKYYTHLGDKLMNHERQLRQAYKKNGIPGIRNYVENVVGLNNIANDGVTQIMTIIKTLLQHANTN